MVMEKLSEITSIRNDLMVLKEGMEGLKSFFTNRLDSFDFKMTEMDSRITALETVKSEVTELATRISDLEVTSRKNEQWARRSNVQINGVPYKEGENLFSVIAKLAGASKFQINPATDIDFITRVAIKSSDAKSPKPIIVKFQTRYKKDDFLAAVRKAGGIKASDIGFVGSGNRIYANDHLSSYYKNLLKLTKSRCKDKNYAYVWVRNCTIMVRRTDKSPVLHITSEEALKNIV